MSGFIAKQPNGLYCRFSCITDCPVKWNMTEEDYIIYCKNLVEDDARMTLKHKVHPFEDVKEYFLDMNMTNEEFEQFLKDVEKPVQEAIKMVEYKYEVNIGGGCATGTVIVPETATDDEIRLEIMSDLYDVNYERVEEVNNA